MNEIIFDQQQEAAFLLQQGVKEKGVCSSLEIDKRTLQRWQKQYEARASLVSRVNGTISGKLKAAAALVVEGNFYRVVVAVERLRKEVAEDNRENWEGLSHEKIVRLVNDDFMGWTLARIMAGVGVIDNVAKWTGIEADTLATDYDFGIPGEIDTETMRRIVAGKLKGNAANLDGLFNDKLKGAKRHLRKHKQPPPATKPEGVVTHWPGGEKYTKVQGALIATTRANNDKSRFCQIARECIALEMNAEAYSYREIANYLGITKTSVVPELISRGRMRAALATAGTDFDNEMIEGLCVFEAWVDLAEKMVEQEKYTGRAEDVALVGPEYLRKEGQGFTPAKRQFIAEVLERRGAIPSAAEWLQGACLPFMPSALDGPWFIIYKDGKFYTRTTDINKAQRAFMLCWGRSGLHGEVWVVTNSGMQKVDATTRWDKILEASKAE